LADELICVAPSHIDQIWPHVSHFIATALKRGCSDYRLDYIHAKLKAGEALLWVVWDQKTFAAAATTEICSMLGEGRLLVITAHGGQDKLWDKYLPELEKYAAAEGCDRVRLYGRHGWIRVLRDHGYTQPWIALEKRIQVDGTEFANHHAGAEPSANVG